MHRAFVLLIAAIFLATAHGAPKIDDDDDSRIINGSQAYKGQYKYMCSLQNHDENGYSKFCGASIISKLWVLTASHCVKSYEEGINDSIDALRVVCGVINAFEFLSKDESEKTAQILEVEKIICHPNYKNVDSGYDVALLKLKTEVKFNQYVQPIRLPPSGYVPFNKWALILGWGATHPVKVWYTAKDLQVAWIMVMESKECNHKYGWIINDSQLCVYDERTSACVGDSGGPLVQRSETGQDMIIGTSSFGFAGNCSAMAAVYSNIEHFTGWIQEQMKKL